MYWKNTETPTFAGSDGTQITGPDVVETMQLLDRDGNVVATFTKAVDGSTSLGLAGDLAVSGSGQGGGTYEIPTGDIDGVNDEFVFSAPPVLVFRNGVMELRKGAVDGSTFTFDTPPAEGDDIEGLV